MRFGTLDDHFDGVAWKRLTATEVNPSVSHEHEFQGVNSLRRLLGDQRREFLTTYMILADDQERDVVIRSTATWYDVRANQAHRTPEWRLYYPADVHQIPAAMKPGDLLVILRTKDGDLLVLLTAARSTREAEVRMLFGIEEGSDQRLQLRLFDSQGDVGVLAARILEQLGVPLPTPDPVGDGPAVMSLADELIERFPDALPPGKQVSALVRERLPSADPLKDPDSALVRWVEAEDTLFRLWEDGLIERRLRKGFDLPNGGKDVRGFRGFSMKIRQSRVSRAGGALQWHVAEILTRHRISYEAQATTENAERPDFLFPSGVAYSDGDYPASRLRMLAVKFTARDRWRQVLNEAARIREKHLLTMEAPISRAQISGMRTSGIIPVIPVPYHDIFSENTRASLITVADLLYELRSAQQTQ